MKTSVLLAPEKTSALLARTLLWWMFNRSLPHCSRLVAHGSSLTARRSRLVAHGSLLTARCSRLVPRRSLSRSSSLGPRSPRRSLFRSSRIDASNRASRPAQPARADGERTVASVTAVEQDEHRENPSKAADHAGYVRPRDRTKHGLRSTDRSPDQTSRTVYSNRSNGGVSTSKVTMPDSASSVASTVN